jgi:hypothetical protein
MVEDQFVWRSSVLCIRHLLAIVNRCTTREAWIMHGDTRNTALRQHVPQEEQARCSCFFVLLRWYCRVSNETRCAVQSRMSQLIQTQAKLGRRSKEE